MVAHSARNPVENYVAGRKAWAQIPAYEKVIILEWMGAAVAKERLDFRRAKLTAAVNPAVSPVDSFEEWTMPIAWPYLLGETS